MNTVVHNVRSLRIARPAAAALLAALSATSHAQTAVFTRSTDTIQIPGQSSLTTTMTSEVWVRSISGTGSARFWNEWTNAQKDITLSASETTVGGYLHPFNISVGLIWTLNNPPRGTTSP